MADDPYVNRGGSYTKPIYTFATLPPAASRQGAVEWITDLSTNPAVTSGQVAVGGGTTRGRVLSDGAAWLIFGRAG